MSDQRWGVELFYFVEGDPPMARVRLHDGQVLELPQPNIQDIPGAFENDMGTVTFNTQGMWYITDADHDNTPGVVYYAPYSTSTFTEVARLPDVTGEGFFDKAAYPGGLVACQPGSRYVSIIGPQGLVKQVELPDGFIGDTAGWERLTLHGVLYRPVDEAISLVFVLQATDLPRPLAVGFTKPAQPLLVSAWVDTLYTLEEALGESYRGIPALVAAEFGSSMVFDFGEVSTPGYGYQYDVLVPSAEVNPGLGVSKQRYALGYLGASEWAPSGVMAENYTAMAATPQELQIDPETLPIPTTYPYELQLRFQPQMTDLTAARVFVDGTPYEMYVGSFIGASSLRTTVRLPTPIFAPGETYDIEVEVTRGGAGTTSRTLTLTAGGDGEGFLTGYQDYSGEAFGSVSSRIVASLSGTTYLADYIRCWPRRNTWGGALFLGPVPINAPFWTAFDGTMEILDTDEPDPTPDPDPEGQYADFVLIAGVNGGDWPFVGYASGEVGSIEPQEPSIGGVSGFAYTLLYALDDSTLYFEIDDIFGATAATLIVEGVGEFQLEVWVGSPYGFEGVIALPESPFVDGETYNIRLYLEGTLSNTPDPGAPGDVVVLGAEMEVGEISPDPLVVGYDQAVDAGTLVPHTFAVGPYTATIVGVALGDGALFHPEWAGSTGVAVAVLFDAPAVGIEFSEAVFRIGEHEVSLSPLDEYVDPATFVGVFDTDWVPAVDSTHPIEVEFRDLVIYEDAPPPPYEPVGDPIIIEIGAVGSIDGLAVGFDIGSRGSVIPPTIEYAGRTYTIQTADMYDRGEGEVEFYFELAGDTDVAVFAGAGFNIGGVLVGSEANTYSGGVRFWAWHEDLQPWEDGETYTITFYPGEEE